MSEVYEAAFHFDDRLDLYIVTYTYIFFHRFPHLAPLPSLPRIHFQQWSKPVPTLPPPPPPSNSLNRLQSTKPLDLWPEPSLEPNGR